MSQRKIFNVLKRNSALRPQHQQHNEVSNPKVVRQQQPKKYYVSEYDSYDDTRNQITSSVTPGYLHVTHVEATFKQKG